MRVLIDGHNSMFAIGVTGKDHEGRRLALLRRVAAVAPEAIVYFDARNATGDGFDRTREAGVSVRYCRNREADAAILEAVRTAKEPGSIIVVTRDREVAGRCAQLGARPVSPSDFFAEAEQQVAPPTRRFPTMRFSPADFGLPDYVDLDDPDPDLA